MLFTHRYCRMLEENSFRGRTSDFVMMFVFGATLMILFAFFVNLLFLGKWNKEAFMIDPFTCFTLAGQAFTIMLVYVWARRNPYVRMSFFGLLTFQAPYLPWVLLGFSLLLGNSISVDLLGMAAGHVYYFLEDVFPNQPNGAKLVHYCALKWPKLCSRSSQLRVGCKIILKSYPNLGPWHFVTTNWHGHIKGPAKEWSLGCMKSPPDSL